jgi:hypothetical protein
MPNEPAAANRNRWQVSDDRNGVLDPNEAGNARHAAAIVENAENS